MVNFIIRDGDKFVLNGNELMRTENPVLEVPDIVGSEEVTEKIAEDVQVGDTLFKSITAFKEIDSHMAGNAETTKNIQFVVYEGSLHAVCWHGDYRGLILLRYDNGEWVMASEPLNSHQSTTARGIERNASARVIDGVLYVTSTFYGFNPGFSILKYEGHKWNEIGPTKISQQLLDNVERDGAGLVRYVNSCDLYKFEDQIHVAVGYEGDVADSTQTVKTYVLDLSARNYIESSMDASTIDYCHDVKFAEYDNNLYLIAGSRSFVIDGTYYPHSVYKWNSSSQNWDLFNHYLGQSASNDSYSVKPFVDSSGSFYIPLARAGGLFSVVKLNTSTSSFEDFGTADSSSFTPSHSLTATMFEVSSNLYLLYGGQTNYDTNLSSTDLYTSKLFKYDFSTSSWDLRQSLNLRVPFSRSAIYSYYGTWGSDFIAHEGTYHCAFVGGYSCDSLKLYTFNPSTELLEPYSKNNSYMPRGGEQIFDGDSITFSGDHFRIVSSDRPPYGVVSKYMSSGEYSGTWFELDSDDINTVQNTQRGARLLEHEGTLYKIFARSNNAVPLVYYEYIPSSMQFYKRADFSQPASYAYSVETGSVSGKDFIAAIHNDNASSLVMYEMSSGSIVRSVDPSTLPPVRTSYNNIAMKVFNGDLYMAYADYSYPYEIYMWKWNGSSWDDITVSLVQFNNGANTSRKRGIKFFERDSKLCLAVRPQAYFSVMILEYDEDTSTLVETESIHQVTNFSPHNHIDVVEKDGRPFILCVGEGSNNGSPVSLLEWTGSYWHAHHLLNFRTRFYDEAVAFSDVSGGIDVHYYCFVGPPIRRTFKFIDEFAYEPHWYKNYNEQLTGRVLATGIALESGSKGDTIKIRKVKR